MKNFVCTVTPAQLVRLREYLLEHSWEFFDAPYAHFRAAHDRVSVVAYCSGKLTVQGANAADFVEFVLEPQILQEILPQNMPFESDAHGGVDESGKGDFFGPLMVAGVFVTPESARKLHDAGVCDSKLIKDDRKILALADIIRSAVNGRFAVVKLFPETYNSLYSRIGNLNRLLAWGHARVIENLLEKAPECQRVISDKFGSEHLIRNALMSRGRNIILEQFTKAESDVAVAAASILARENFVLGMKKLSESAGMDLPKGAGPQVRAAALKIAREKGTELLSTLVKTHFKTYDEVLKML